MMKERNITENDLGYLGNGYIDYIDGEIWRTSEDFPAYIFSSYGRVFSLWHRKLLKPYFCPYKRNVYYYYVRLKNKDGVFHGYKLHRIIADVFCPNPLNKKIIHHIDGDSLNNKADNLMWVTFSEHMELHKRMNKVKKVKNAA